MGARLSHHGSDHRPRSYDWIHERAAYGLGQWKRLRGSRVRLESFAISALNEVESEDAMVELERALEATTQEGWSYHISPREVGNKDGSEYYAFIWRDARVSFLEALDSSMTRMM